MKSGAMPSSTKPSSAIAISSSTGQPGFDGAASGFRKGVHCHVVVS
jgi:hypothetical protein